MGTRAAQVTLIGDVRLRLLAALLLVTALSQVQSLTIALIALLLVLLGALITRLPARLWRRILQVETFVLLLFLTLPFAVAGTPVLTLGPLAASAEGLERAALIAVKVSAALLTIMVLVGTVEPARIGAGLHALKFPERIVQLYLMTVRYLSLIRAEAIRLHDAMRARAFAPRSNRHTWRSYGYLIGMLLVRALDRAARVEEAMRCRGAAGHYPHAALPAPLTHDWIGFALIAGLAAALLLSGFA